MQMYGYLSTRSHRSNDLAVVSLMGSLWLIDLFSPALPDLIEQSRHSPEIPETLTVAMDNLLPEEQDHKGC